MTYSIVARDAETGELGVAVQSQAFNTGALVPWARAGVGVVATQSFVDPRYGWSGLELLASGASPQAALLQLRAADSAPGLRQVAMLNVKGELAQWTGADCVARAGQVSGEGWAAQGNMLASEGWRAMGEAFVASAGSLAQRLLRALEAAEESGGDWRGRGGAAIVVVPASGEPWDRLVDIRVEDGDGSLGELRRLLQVAEAYRWADEAQPAAPVAAEGGLPEQYVRLLAVVDAAVAGDPQEARSRLSDLEAIDPRWRDVLRAMAKSPEAPPLDQVLS